jgi:hypothetical protein
MRKTVLFSALMIALLAVLAVLPAAAQDQKPEAVITLERTACFGTCPVYTVTIFDDGSVVYNGTNFVDVEGEQTVQIDPEIVKTAVKVFEDAGYFDWNDEYMNMTVTDQPYVTISVTRDGETKKISHYYGDENAPLALTYVEAWVDIIASTEQWVGQPPALYSFSTTGTPVITLDRGYCFGDCPVFQAVLYEDGTVMYMGFANVDMMGIHTGSIEPEVVAQLADDMKAEGYFTWNDEYLKQSITDQATVVTTLVWEGEYKRIVHYTGDDTAPEALTPLEDAIDRALEDAEWVAPEPGATEEPQS